MFARSNVRPAVFAAALLSSVAHAGALPTLVADTSSQPIRASQSAILDNLTYEAANQIVGQAGTGTSVATPPGDPRYLATAPFYSGVAALQTQYSFTTSAGGSGVANFVCTGSLLPDRVSILTAAHCVTPPAPSTSNGVTTTYTGVAGVTAWFYGGGQDVVVYNNPAVATGVAAASFARNPLYSGRVVDSNDTAVLRLSAPAPAFARSYQLSPAKNLSNLPYNVAGYGLRSTTGGNVGTSGANALGTGRLRQGINRYDFSYGNALWGGFFTNQRSDGSYFFGGNQDVSNTWISGFYQGNPANDQACLLATLGFGYTVAQVPWCGNYDNNEVTTAGGDSGGPQFVYGLISSVTSFGQSYGTAFGDFLAGLNNSWGELNGFAPVYSNLAFIRSQVLPGTALVPAPGTVAVLGLGLAGLAALRRRKA